MGKVMNIDFQWNMEIGQEFFERKKTCGLYFVTALTTVTAFALHDCVGYRSDYGLVL